MENIFKKNYFYDTCPSSLVHVHLLRLSCLIKIVSQHILSAVFFFFFVCFSGNGITLEGAVPTEQDSQPKPAKRARTSFTAEQLQVRHTNFTKSQPKKPCVFNIICSLFLQIYSSLTTFGGPVCTKSGISWSL